MDAGTLIGLIIGFGGILIGYFIESNFNLAAFLNLFHLTAVFIVLGGTAGATILATPKEDLKIFLNKLKEIFFTKSLDEMAMLEKIIQLAEKSRREGLLSLEAEMEELDHPIMKKGIALVVDGVDGSQMRAILTKEISIHQFQYETAIQILERMGGYSPTMGVIGTVMGMVNILGELGGEPNAMARSIAVAFIATLYGVAFANLVYLPMSERLRGKMARVMLINDMVIEGLLSILSGENPRVIKEKLSYEIFEQMHKGSMEKEEMKDEMEE